jgi:hypothetical protein
MNRSHPATFQAYYNEPYNALVKPHRFLWYLRQKWMRELKPLGTAIVLYLRGLCYYNPDKGELRDVCEVRMEEIAEAVGVSRATVARELSDGPDGEPVNPALRRFVVRQQQYNLTEKGIRRATTLYHVSMDDPIHPDDEAQYTLLCRQFQERNNSQQEGVLKPRILRKSQNETYGATSDDSKSQNETLATGCKSHFETTYKGDLYSLCTYPLNVSACAEEIRAPKEKRSTLNAKEKGIHAVGERAVKEIVNLTGDEGSRRRFWQLWEVAERNQSLDAWKAALQALQRRLGAKAQGTLERPGAYFCKICIQELEKREVFIPTNAERQAEAGVGNIIRQGLFESQKSETDEPEIPETALPVAATLPQSTLSAEQLDQERLILEREGGAPYDSFLAFVATERDRYEAEIGSISATAKGRLLATFDQPQKRRSLFHQWRSRMC